MIVQQSPDAQGSTKSRIILAFFNIVIIVIICPELSDHKPYLLGCLELFVTLPCISA